MPHRGTLQRHNSKVSLQSAVFDSIEPVPSHRPLFLINTSDCCLTASDSRAGDAARSEARKVSGWSSSIQHPYRPLGVVAPVILPPSYKKKGSTVRNGHVLHAFTAPRPPTPLSSSIDAAAVAAPAQLIPRPPPRNDVSASSHGEHEGEAGSGSVSSRRRLVPSESFQYDASALDSFRFVTAALNQGKTTFRKLKASVSSAELRAKMCKAGSSSKDAVQWQCEQQQMQQQRLNELQEHVPQSPQEPRSTAAVAAAAAAVDVAAALQGPVIIPRLALGSLSTSASAPLHLEKPPPLPASLSSIDIILGRNSVAHPVKELRNIALDMSGAVCDAAAFLDKQLKLQDCERLDTNRRKLAALTSVSAIVPRAASDQLKSMRLMSERERLQASLRLLQNRRWYHELQLVVRAEGQGNGQRELFLLGCIRRLIEEGVVLDGSSVKLLMSLYTQPSMSSEFASPTVQCILGFLCEKFKVSPAQYDDWLRGLQLPLPPETIARDQRAYQKRNDMYKKETIAKWFRQKAGIMSMTKDLQYWLPPEIIAHLNLHEDGGAADASFLTQEMQQVTESAPCHPSEVSRAQSRGKSRADALSRPSTGRSGRGLGSDDERNWGEVAAAAHLQTLKERSNEKNWKQKQQKQQDELENDRQGVLLVDGNR